MDIVTSEQGSGASQVETHEGMSAAQLPRRTILAVGTAGLAGVALAACSSGSSSAPTGTSPDTPADSTGVSGTVVTSTTDVPVGGAKLAKASGTTWLVAQPTAGTYVCYSGICTHQGCPLTQVVGDEAICNCHGSKFNANDGAVIQGPATEPLPKRSVKVSGTDIVLG